jgi:hypothetical protein
MIIVAVWLAVVLLVLAFAILFRRLASRVDAEACNPEWLDDFSTERFAPMERLLDPGDFEFLKAQPGYRPSIGARLLRERRRAFAGYLRLLTRDFNQLLGIAKLMLIYSSEDRPEFAKALWQQQIRFYVAICTVRCRMAFYPLGWTGVDTRNLVKSLEILRQQIQELAVLRVEAY